VQRTINCQKIQDNNLTPHVVLNSLIYGTSLHHHIKLDSKMVRVLWPAPSISIRQDSRVICIFHQMLKAIYLL